MGSGTFQLTMRLTLLACGLAAVLAVGADGRQSCRRPAGHHVGQCRYGVHGTPDLSRAEWRRRSGAEVSISLPIDALAPNPSRGRATEWPLLDSLGKPMGDLVQGGETAKFHMSIRSLKGKYFRATTVHIRGRGCAADLGQQRGFALVQIIAPESVSHGTQGFLATAALHTSSDADSEALAAFEDQHGTSCGPAGRIMGRARPLRNPRVGAFAHARLSDGRINTVNEYDAKPDFANVVYFTTNTTSVSVGGIARGMVRVGTPVAKVDQFHGCDPNSDGTLTWRYWAIKTGNAKRPKIYGWIPARCAAHRGG
jgi:hypothetical protein